METCVHISVLLKEIKADQTIQASNYSGMRKTRFILPGYLKERDEDWPQDMCKARKNTLSIYVVDVPQVPPQLKE